VGHRLIPLPRIPGTARPDHREKQHPENKNPHATLPPAISEPQMVKTNPDNTWFLLNKNAMNPAETPVPVPQNPERENIVQKTAVRKLPIDTGCSRPVSRMGSCIAGQIYHELS
jgi:hypothetical protein